MTTTAELVGEAQVPGELADAASVLAQARSENFSVASRLLPRRVRDELRAIYGYCRFVDDLGDEYEGDRLGALAWAGEELEAAFGGRAHHPVFVALQPLLGEGVLGPEPFLDLIEANRLDQRKHRYATFAELVGYCRLSANPVGRLVLGVFGASSPPLEAASDDVCTALQLVEHLQDVVEDYRAGRIYLPSEDLAAFGVAEEDLGATAASPALRRLVAFEAGRTRRLLLEGSRLVGELDGLARLAVAGFVGGGLAQLDAMAQVGYDVCSNTVKASRARVAWRSAAVLSRAGSPRSTWN